MRLLIIYADIFSYTPVIRTLDDAAEKAEPASIEKSVVGFIHAEAEDEEKLSAVETKLVKNLKWAARKNDTQKIVLHSFAHLSGSKADPQMTKQLMDRAEERLKTSGYETFQTPFGYFLDLKVDAPGHPLARLFKEF